MRAIPPGRFVFSKVGGALCLDFTNTVSWRTGPDRTEHLTRYTDLLDWAEQHGVLTGTEAERLRGRAETDPGAAEVALRKAISLRDAVFRLFRTCDTRDAARTSDLATLDRARRVAMSRSRLVIDEQGVRLGWPDTTEPMLDRPCWPVALSAAELLCSPEAPHVSMCAADNCGWLFLDHAGRRRWCTMRGCGNRAKAARHYARRTGRAADPPSASSA